MTVIEDNYPPVPERRRFTIGEAARLANRPPHILRYWEKEVLPLANVERRNGRRYYSREQVLMMQQVSRMLHSGVTLAGINNQICNKKSHNQLSAVWVRRELEKILSIL